MIETGRVTVPTDVDVIDATIEIINRWKADAIRDCDGTDMPEELRKMDIKQYATYYTTRKDNAWAKANPDEIQQMYLRAFSVKRFCPDFCTLCADFAAADAGNAAFPSLSFL